MGAVSTSTVPMWTPGAVGRVTASDWIAGVCGALQALSSAAPKAPAPISAARRVNDKVSIMPLLPAPLPFLTRLKKTGHRLAPSLLAHMMASTCSSGAGEARNAPR